MNTTKKLIIGAVALAAVVIGMQGQEENVFIGGREVLDYRNAGLKEFKRDHRLYMATSLDLRDNDLGELVLPAGMVYLKTINLTGNNNFTNLFLQQDTAIEWPIHLDVYLDSIDNVKISLPSWIVGFRVWAYIDPINNKDHQRRYKDLISRYGWQRHSRTRIPLEFIPKLEVRPNGVELIRKSEILPHYKNEWIISWGAGDLEHANDLEDDRFGWRKYFNSRPSYSPNTAGSVRASRIEYWFPSMLATARPAWGHESRGFFRLKPWSTHGIKVPELPASEIPTVTIENDGNTN